MSVDSAWRRFGAANGAICRNDDPLRMTPPARVMRDRVSRFVAALSVAGGLVLGAVALVQILDVILDRLRDCI